MTRLAAASLLALALLAGAFLRFNALGEPSYWLDEILGEVAADGALAQPWWHWVTGVHPEHGPLYYAVQLASRAAGRDELAGRLPAALFGLCTIPLIWLAARSKTAAAIVAFLLAASPLHVYYSREARPYALLLLLAALVLIALLRGSRRILLIALVAMLFTSVAAAPLIAAAAVAASAGALITRERRDWMPALFAAIALAPLPLMYRSASRGGGNAFPGVDLDLLLTIVKSWTVTALGAADGERGAIAMLLFAIAGAFALARRDRRACAIVVTMTIAPAVFAVLALWMTNHFFAARYVAGSLIGFLVLAGTGIVACGEWIARRWALAIAIPIVIVLAIPMWTASRREPFQKLDWRLIAATLRERARPGDVIATAQPYSYLSLRHYLRDLPPGVHFVLLDTVPLAEQWTSSTPAAWLVHSGHSTDVSHWMCRYPLLLASPLEGFRLHYAPSARAFLLDRSLPAERPYRSGGFTLQMGGEDDVFLGSGWASAEGSLRWASATRATVTLPSRCRKIRFRAYPLTHASLPPQTLRIVLNGLQVASLTLAPEWREYEVAVPGRDGMNELTFEFARATAPSSLDPHAPDGRELAAMFDWIAIDEGRNTVTPPLRLATRTFLDARTAWRNTRTRFPAGRLRRDAVESLLDRLGFDPQTVWPQLVSGDVRLDDVVETIAYGSCEDPTSFVHRAFAVLLERMPADDEVREAVAMKRVDVVSRIVKSAQFRARMLR